MTGPLSYEFAGVSRSAGRAVAATVNHAVYGPFYGAVGWAVRRPTHRAVNPVAVAVDEEVSWEVWGTAAP